MNVLIIIPARGGSKGIPRKNLRPLAGKPLLHYSIQTSLASAYQPDVYVTSEDDEVLFMAKKLGAKTYERPPELSGDDITLDPVIYDAYRGIRAIEGKDYDLIVTLQPTSPLLKTITLDEALDQMARKPSIDTMIAAVDDTHLTWGEKNGEFIPNYQERLNRQYLPKTYKETGGFLITRKSIISEHNRIGKNTQLAILTRKEGIDIDTFEDFNLCEFYLKRKTILFVVAGYPAIGLGHIYNTLILAHEITNHRLIFLVDENSRLGLEKIRSNNYEVHMQESPDILDDIMKFKPYLVINDRLDTTTAYMNTLRSRKIRTLNIEDLGEGAMLADVVVNAIYPEKKAAPNHYYGPDYFCAREEFFLTPVKPVREKVGNILITFGGVDPANLTLKTLEAIYDHCIAAGISIHVVTGLGYENAASLEAFKGIELHRNIINISELMSQADMAFTSAGRTTYELALLGIPSIILCQNAREQTHFFADERHGFINLGLGEQVATDLILDQFRQLLNDHDRRRGMQEKMLKNDIREGKRRVVKLIHEILEKP